MSAFESIPSSQESVGDYLVGLEQEGKYLFHGSPNAEITLLEPRLSSDAGAPEGSETIDTAVFAGGNFMSAVQMAIIAKGNFQPQGSMFSTSHIEGGDGTHKFVLTVTPGIIFAPGTVYILPRDGFVNFRGNEWKSKREVKPLGSVTVDKKLYEDMGGEIVVRP